MTKNTVPIAIAVIVLAACGWAALFAFDPHSETIRRLHSMLGNDALSGPRSALSGPSRFFDVQSIDTMKLSRDLARDKLSDPSFDRTIDRQMELIKAAGATHVAIDTPYDGEFLPILGRWIRSARDHGLSIWLRGNFSGWEGWFGYGKIDMGQHEQKLRDFLSANISFFRDGDIFSPCPECENGGPGDPRSAGSADAYNGFIADEYRIARDAFSSAGKDVDVYSSANADIVSDSIRSSTIRAMDGAVLIDHYAKDPESFAAEVRDIGGKLSAAVGIGEFGAPIPDINGGMSEDDQAEFIRKALDGLAGLEESHRPPLVNYWVLQGGSTAIVTDAGEPKKAYSILASYYEPTIVTGTVTEPSGKAVVGARVSVQGSEISTLTGKDGRYRALVPGIYHSLLFEKDGWSSATGAIVPGTETDAVMEPSRAPTWWQRIKGILTRSGEPRSG